MTARAVTPRCRRARSSVHSARSPSRSRSRPQRDALRLTRRLHAAPAHRREDPQLEGRARGRAEACDRALRRPQGLDGAPRRPRPGGGAAAPRPGARADDGGGPPLRGHGEPGHGRRDHGALRRAARPRGPRGARLLRGAPDAGDRRRATRKSCGARDGHRRSRSASGLNSGEVVVRSIGSDLHMDYTAVGQTTHLAARMEQMATPGSILTDRADAPALAEGYVLRPARLGPVPVKGLDDSGRRCTSSPGPRRSGPGCSAARGARAHAASSAAMQRDRATRRGCSRRARSRPRTGGRPSWAMPVSASRDCTGSSFIRHRTRRLARPRVDVGLLRQGDSRTCRSSICCRCYFRIDDA